MENMGTLDERHIEIYSFLYGNIGLQNTSTYNIII